MRANFVMSGVATGMRRNLLMTIALILVGAIGFGAVGSALLANSEITKFKHIYQGKLNVSIQLCATKFQPPPGGTCTHATTPQELDTIRGALSSDPNVVSFQYISEDEWLQLAREAQPNLAKFIQPGVLPATYSVHLHDLAKDYDSFQAKYAKFSGVGQVSNQIDTFKTLLNLINSMRWLSLIVALLVLIASTLLIIIFVQVAAEQRKNETSIMRLVGASRWMTELPFMLETIIACAMGGILAFAGLWVGKDYVLNGVFNGPTKRGVIPNLDVNDVLKAGGIGLLVGIVLAAVTAFATLRLRVRL